MSEQYAEQAEAVVDNDTSALDSEPSLVLDEDRLGTDPLEDGMDTAEDYSRQVKVGGTLEAEEQDTLAYRLPQEEPDPVQEEIDEVPGRPVAATPIDDLDESVDEPDPALDGVTSRSEDALAPDGATEAEDVRRPVELGVDGAAGSNEPTGLPADDGVGEMTAVENEWPTEGAEQEALRIEQES